jgi:tetratricopeptide (TPR) repeat protein
LLQGNAQAAKREYLDTPRTIASKTDELMDLDVQIGIFQELHDTASLLPALKEMADRCAAAGLRDREADAYKLLGYTHYSLDEWSIAHGFFDRALTLSGDHDVSRRERADILYFRSLVRLAENDYPGAFADATQSVQESIVLTNELALESVKRYARTQHVERYAHLAFICGHLDRIPEALEYLERSRSGLLNALLATQHINPSPDVPADLVNQLRDLQTRRRRLDLLIVQEQETPLYKGRMGELVGQLLALTSTWDDLVEKIATYDPLFEQFRDVPIRYEQIEALIPRDKRTALLEFCVADTSTQVVLVVPGLLQRAYTIQGLSRHRLHDLLKQKWFGPLHRLRTQQAIGDRARTRASDLDAMSGVLGELHHELFGTNSSDGETLTASLARHHVERLLIVPHGLLHLMPLHALWHNANQERRYLIDEFEIVYAPSCGVLRYCSRNTAGCGSLVAFADPDGSLRGARDEAAAIKHHFTTATVYTGPDATVDTALHVSITSDVLHFACHGSFDAQSPLSSALSMADGKLTLNRIFEECRVKPGALVTLSACETGMVAPDRTDEYIGLPSGFLFAGANCVVGSLWPVDDACTSTVMQATYMHIQQHNESPAASLRAAQRSLKTSNAYAHPYFWAPFQVVGAGWSPRHRA